MPTPPSIEDEVLGNIRALPLGAPDSPSGSVGQLGLPLDFLRRVADRVIQSTFRERWRLVVGDGTIEHGSPPPGDPGPVPSWIRVVSDRQPPSGPDWRELRPADPAFRAPLRIPQQGVLGARAENSTDPVRAFRVQMTGPGYYAGPGDGGSLDILRQLVELADRADFCISVESKHLPGVLSAIRSWQPREGVKLIVIPEPLPVSQWARDNTIALRDGKSPSWLTPRWASRGEEGGIFIPGESFLAEGLAAAGFDVAQSPLLFEGGNLMLVEDGQRRTLLIGEAEIHRNIGTPREGVVQAFKSHLHADDAIILPAASFHIDLETTLAPVVPGSHDSKPCAFVLDTLAAVRIVCRLATRRLGEAGLLPPSVVAECAKPETPLSVLSTVMNSVMAQTQVAEGRHNFDCAALFKASDTDSAVGNLQRIRFAADWLMAELGTDGESSNHFAAYLRSLRRTERDRAAIARALRQRGWKLVKVPGISADSVSLNPVNGLWIAGDSAQRPRFLMPAYGGFFAELDQAAAAIVASQGFDVVPVLTGETQRRGGGLHCAVSLA